MRFVQFAVSALAVFAVGCEALAHHNTVSSHVVKENIFSHPSHWNQIGRAHPSSRLQLHIAVRQQNVEELEAALLERADPTSPQYAQHLSFEEVNELVRPHQKSVESVLLWLASENVDMTRVSRSPNSDWISVQVTVEQAERMLDTTYHQYKHSTHSGHIITRATHYSLPSHLHDHIDFVGPTVRFPIINPLKPVLLEEKESATDAAADDDDCSSSVTPSCLKSLYNIDSYTSVSKNNSAAVTGYLGQYISTTDLSSFFSQFATASSGQSPTILGPNDATQPGIEASLDIQYLMGVATNLPATFEYTAGNQPNNTQNEPFLVWLMNLASNPTPSYVYSTSYGDNENTVLFDYATRVNTEFVKAGARGISILYSSGDGGVAGGQAGLCTDFIPTFPAGSPYVTAVGSTTSVNPETAASFSSGGFANYWPRPSYQDDAVNNYLTKYGTNLPSSNLYNSSGRGFPDVSTQGVNFEIVVSGFTQGVSGTSCSSPTFAAIIALLNDQRLAVGKSSLGFLNPLFYKNPQVFNDILTGNNPGCGTNGFYASQGWDPITGNGTPDFKKLSALVLSLP